MRLKPDGIEVLKQMGVLFKTASFKEIRVAGHADKASASDGSSQYFEKLALSKARATQTVRVLKGDEWIRRALLSNGMGTSGRSRAMRLKTGGN